MAVRDLRKFCKDREAPWMEALLRPCHTSGKGTLEVWLTRQGKLNPYPPNNEGPRTKSCSTITGLVPHLFTDKLDGWLGRLSSSALEKNIKEAEALKTRAERQLEAILKETVMLEEETSRTEAIHEKMKASPEGSSSMFLILLQDPLQVAEENLIIRSKRPTREQTRDAVERSLNEQIAGAKHSIRMLGGVLDACDKELAKLKVCREKLEEDIDQKRIALEVDNEALRMESGWAANIQSKRAPSASLPHMWRQRTENLCEECERTRATCERLRAKSKAIQEEALNVERETREAVLRNFARKMEETDRLKSELESSIANVSNEIVTMEDARASVEQSMNDKHGPLALAKSRLR
eukprot:760906-Hanusia_phi.AAC.8